MTRFARTERHALCDTLILVGPDAPTLCEGWLTRDLAAHLVLRERRPDAAAGMWLPFLSQHTQTVQDEMAQQPWPALVDTIRQGPPVYHFSAVPALDELTNTAEFFIHHEDVRRGARGWVQRELDEDYERALGRVARGMGRLTYRRSPVGVVLDAPGYGRATVNGKSDPVIVTGAPGELLLHAYGRGDHARVDVDGGAGSLEALDSVRLGI